MRHDIAPSFSKHAKTSAGIYSPTDGAGTVSTSEKKKSSSSSSY